ncbi:MAG: VIT1/CCC1 transporter family protein [Thaumarchaeota archaeon]|nr:VIT1/CCC1 transporter family protein [Nitrososphaerota archaeon]
MEGEREEKHAHIPARDIINRIVLGGTDGVIESIAITAGLNGAGIVFSAIRLAGVAFAFAGAFSMFFSSYISGRAEQEILRKDIARERMEIETEPDEEKAELEALLKEEGYGAPEIETIVKRVIGDKDLWLRLQIRLELHQDVANLEVNPLKGAGPAGVLFFIAASLPIVPYAFPITHEAALLASLVVALTMLFIMGGTKFTTLREVDLKAGLEYAVIGGVAATILYAIGHFITFV